MRIAATTSPATVGPVDLILFLVKSYHTDDAARLAGGMVVDRTVVATMQNGMGNGDILAAAFNPDQVVLGVTAESGTTLAPGVVDHPGRAATFVGPYEGGGLEPAKKLADALCVGLRCRTNNVDRDRDLAQAGGGRVDASRPRAARFDMR